MIRNVRIDIVGPLRAVREARFFVLSIVSVMAKKEGLWRKYWLIDSVYDK